MGAGARTIVLAPVDGDLRTQESASRPLIITTINRRCRIREVLHIEKHEAICELCGGIIALTRKKLEEKVREYAVIVDEQVMRMICETCRKEALGAGLTDIMCTILVSCESLRNIGDGKSKYLIPNELNSEGKSP
ncbi:MAG: hypothetical protein L2C94_005235 [Aigarchaeota archaeon]|nr:hypothetical protein [Candidatus Wolframiiraptor gerlachensis]